MAVKKEGAGDEGYEDSKPDVSPSPPFYSSSCATTVAECFPEHKDIVVTVSTYVKNGATEPWKAVIFRADHKNNIDVFNMPEKLLRTSVKNVSFDTGASKQDFTLDNDSYTFAKAMVRTAKEKESEIRRLASYVLNLNTKNFTCPEDWIQSEELSLYASVSEDVYRRGGFTGGEHGSWNTLCSHRALRGPGPALVRHVKQELENDMHGALGYIGWKTN